jgi:iron transport multicopper oxidase
MMAEASIQSIPEGGTSTSTVSPPSFGSAQSQFVWAVNWLHPSLLSPSGNPDGILSRSVNAVFGQWPIPPVHAVQGDLLILRVTNNFNETSGVHFHGLFQKETNYNDGAGGITDCGIAPEGGQLEYRVQLDQLGSFWNHGHKEGQYSDGLRTTLIIHEEEKDEQSIHQESTEEFTLALSE